MLEVTQTTIDLPSKASVSGILAELVENSVHVVLSRAEDEQIYIVYDFDMDEITKAMPLSGASPFVTLMTVNQANTVEAFLVAESGEGVYKATFDKEEEFTSIEALIDCDSDFILESLHIAFMQQEALNFQQQGGFSGFKQGHYEQK